MAISKKGTAQADLETTPEADMFLEEETASETVAVTEVPPAPATAPAPPATATAAPKAEATEVPPATAPTAEAPPATPPATAPATSGTVPMLQGAGALLSADEMKDLDFGFGAFPIIKLNRVFECDDEGIAFSGSSFLCIIQRYSARWIYSEKTAADVSSDNFFYTYNDPKDPQGTERITTSGEPFDPILEAWKAEGIEHTISKYLEVVVLLKGDNEGKVAILQISPASINRFSGYVAVELQTLKGLHYRSVITEVSAGAKIKTKNNREFNPWAFAFNSEA